MLFGVTLPPPDLCAAIFGALCAAFSFFRGPGDRDVTNVAIGFASGSSAFLLTVVAISVFVNEKLFEALLVSNRVLLFGAIGYAAFINARTVPGALTLFATRRTS